jgi:hypothetical protein
MPQQPQQLTPQQQIWADLEKNQPDTAARIRFNGRQSDYASVEFKRQQELNNINRINADAAPNSPFLTNLLEQARQQTIQQHQQLNTGQPQTADQFNAQWTANYNRLHAPAEATYSANLKSANGRIDNYENKLSEYSEEHRPLLSEAQSDKLQSLKQGINTVDIMTNRWQNILKTHPELASNPGGDPLAHLESYANDPQVRSYISTVPLITSYYAKHIGSESGKLSDFDMKTARGAIPQPGDSLATVAQKGMDLKQMMASDYQSALAGYQNTNRTGDWQPIDLNNPSTYAPTPRADTGYANPENSFSPGRNPPPDPTQNPTVGQPSAQATPSPTPTPQPDYVGRASGQVDDWLRGNANQQAKQQSAAAQQQQAVAQQAQQQAAQQAQQQSAAAQQAGAQAAQQQPMVLPPGFRGGD